MDKAFDVTLIGNPIMIDATSITGKSIKASEERYRCPVCGEYLAFVAGGRNVNHFRHKKKNDFTIDCDNRVSTTQIAQNYYEIKGSPLYIRKDDRCIFKLFMGFSGLSRQYSSILRNEKITMIIKGTGQIKKIVDDINFNLDEPTLLEIGFLPINKKYSIHYECSNNKIVEQLNRKWSSFSDFDFSLGVLFSFSENGGKKLGVGSVIYSETEYIYLGKHKPPEIKGLEVEQMGVVVLGSTTLYVIKIMYKEVKSSVNDFAINFCEEKLRLIYQSKSPEVIPLWPPVYNINGELSAINNTDAVILYAKYLNNRKIIKSTDKSHEELEIVNISENDALFGFKLSIYNNMINIDSKYCNPELIINNRFRKRYGFKLIHNLIDSRNNKIVSKLITGSLYNFSKNIESELVYFSENFDVYRISDISCFEKLVTVNRCGLVISKSSNFVIDKFKVVQPKKPEIMDDFILSCLVKKLPKSGYIHFSGINAYLAELRNYPLTVQSIRKIRDGNRIPYKVKQILIELGGRDAK